jgi:hypothetical protein
MLQWLHTYGSTVYSNYFIYFKRMLQVFYPDVAYVASVLSGCCICCKYFYLDVAYVVVVIHVYCKRMALFIQLIIRLFELVFSARTVFFSHNKSANRVFQPAYQHSRTAPIF